MQDLGPREKGLLAEILSVLPESSQRSGVKLSGSWKFLVL
jgi:hypothetical protein